MRILTPGLCLFLALTAVHAQSDVAEAWRVSFPAGSRFYVTEVEIASDNAGNLFVLTDTVHDNLDITLAKYSPDGNPLWVRHYNGEGNTNDISHALKVDSNGNVFVAGSSGGANGNGNVVAIKYDANGNRLWVAEYNNPVFTNTSDGAIGIGLDAEGNVYVGGVSLYYPLGTAFSPTMEYLAIKLGPLGNRLWAVRYFPETNTINVPIKMVVDNAGNTFMTGYSSAFTTYYDFLTIKLDSSGNVVWTTASEQEPVGNIPYGFAIDSQGNAFVGGDTQGGDFGIQKFNGSYTEWVAAYAGNPQRFHESIVDLAVDDQGNVYATGSLTIDVPGCLDDSDALATLKYSTDGVLQWVRLHEGPVVDGCRQTYATALALDARANVYVTALERVEDRAFEWITLKYDSAGRHVWSAQAAISSSFNAGRSILVGADQSVYVAGLEHHTNGTSSALIIKYVQGSPNSAPVADASATPRSVIAGNGVTGGVTLDGSASSDPDNDPLRYFWFRAGSRTLLATGVIASVTLPTGVHELELQVDDGRATNSQPFTVRVITPCQAIDDLAQRVRDINDRKLQRILLSHLKQACASFDSGRTSAAIQQLELFSQKALLHTATSDPDAGRELARAAQDIIDAVNAAVPTITL